MNSSIRTPSQPGYAGMHLSQQPTGIKPNPSEPAFFGLWVRRLASFGPDLDGSPMDYGRL